MAKTETRETLLLMQKGPELESRTFFNFDSVEQCLEFIVKLFEDRLRSQLSSKENFTYDLGQLFSYVDGVPDMFCLVYNEQGRNFTPHGKDWIKSKLYKILSKQAAVIDFDN